MNSIKGVQSACFTPHLKSLLSRVSLSPIHSFFFFLVLVLRFNPYTTPTLQAPTVSRSDGLAFLHGSTFSRVFGCRLQGGRLSPR
jgi:hypothetical protein